MIGDAILRYENEIVHHIQELIRIRSVASAPLPGKPFGEGVDRALQYMLRLGEELGFRTENVDGYAGYVEYGEGDDYVAVLVHLDTVPEGSGWSSDALGADIRDGCIYGRGASDDKGPAVVALYALKAIADAGLKLDRRIRIVFGTDEETGMTDMDYYFTKHPLPKYGFSPDAGYPITNAEKGYYVVKLAAFHEESSANNGISLTLKGGSAPNVVPDACEALIAALDENGERLVGRMRALAERHAQVEAVAAEGGLVLRAKGKSAHGAYPPAGVNAIAHLLAFLQDAGVALRDWPLLALLQEKIGFESFGETLGIACSDPVHGRLTLNFASAAVNGANAEAVLNIRHPVTSSGDDMIAKLTEEARAYGTIVTIEDIMLPLFVEPDHPLIRKLSHAYETVTGEPAELLSIGGGTYARKLQNRGVAFGAGFRGVDTKAHQPDEFVSIADMMKHGRICTQALSELAIG